MDLVSFFTSTSNKNFGTFFFLFLHAGFHQILSFYISYKFSLYHFTRQGRSSAHRGRVQP